MTRKIVTIDGNEAAAYIAHKTNEVIAIFPITPSSAMGEWADQWSVAKKPNIWGTVPSVIEMQSEAGAAGAVHGALQTGALTTTFTASQGLLLMIPNMYKIAGELTSAVFHIAARAVAAQALSIFGDHSDVMATRGTGWAMLFANNNQEIMDLALITQAATLEARVPFLHIFDGFRSSHEINKMELLDDEDIRHMIDDDLVRAHRARGLTPDAPVIRGTAQNPDVFFQARETVNPYYLAIPTIVQNAFDKFAKLTGRQYNLFEYVGPEDAERVIVVMGSACGAVEETIDYLAEQGEKVGMVKVRLYRPFSLEHLIEALPATVKTIAVLDRTKEPGSGGEPLYKDVVTAISESLSDGSAPFEQMPRIIGGRYGLSSKEFTPAMIKGIFDEMTKQRPKNHFTIGINDDVTHTSLAYDPDFFIEPDEVVRAMFWGLGSDGTVGANKNSIKIIGVETDNYAQGYFVYDSKKAGAKTISHLRFGPNPIKSSYLITRANFVGVHQFDFLTKYEVLKEAGQGAIFLLNAPYPTEEVWGRLPHDIQEIIIEKNLKFYAVNADQVAKDTEMWPRINVIMQTCFFAISGILPQDEAIAQIKGAIKKTYGKFGPEVVAKNNAAVDASLENLHEIPVPEIVSSTIEILPVVPAHAPAFVQNVTATIIAGNGDSIPVSMLPVDGTYPTATTQWEKRNIADMAPIWETDTCIQCGKCILVCPHAVIRAKIYEESALVDPPETFKTADSRFKEYKDHLYTLQVAIEDCTGCNLCYEACPVKDKENPEFRAINMAPQRPLRETERENWDYFLTLPEIDHDHLKFTNVKNVQLLRPLFEFSGACAGCGETPYIKLMTQLFGDHTVIANATGCTSIFGGNLPTTPYAQDACGRGPAWSNSLFEDNAEFGLGMRITLDKQIEYASELLTRMQDIVGENLVDAILTADQSGQLGIEAQRERVTELKTLLAANTDTATKDLISLADVLVKKNVWIMGGDGWAYDIGYGGLDHVLASGHNVNVVVLDTEVYSNTGGQASKATPIGAIAKFASAGKELPKKDLGMIAMTYGNIYVAQIAMGAKDGQTVKAFLEAEAYDGPSLIIAYSQCIEHRLVEDMEKGMEQQALAVKSGHWPLYRYDPRRRDEGKNPFQLDSKPPKITFAEYAYRENRYRRLTTQFPDRAEDLMDAAQKNIDEKWVRLLQMAEG